MVCGTVVVCVLRVVGLLTIFVFFFFDVVRIFFKEDVKDVKIYYLYYKVFLFLI